MSERYATTIDGRPDVTVTLTRERGKWIASTRHGRYTVTPEGYMRRGKLVTGWRVIAPPGVTF